MHVFSIHFILFLYNRGDTQSSVNKGNKLHLRLDLRVVMDGHIEFLTGEFSSKNACSEVKHKADLMKSLVSTKSSLNHILARVTHQQIDLSTIYLPFLQVCGLELTLNVLSMDKPGSLLFKVKNKFLKPVNVLKRLLKILYANDIFLFGGEYERKCLNNRPNIKWFSKLNFINYLNVSVLLRK